MIVNNIDMHNQKATNDFSYLANDLITNIDPANSCTFHFLCLCSRCQSLPRSPNFNDLQTLIM